MTTLMRFEGTLWRDGDRNPTVVVGSIQQDGDRYYGEVTLEGLYPERAIATPGDWKLLPQQSMLLRVKLAQKAGDVFIFEGEMNVERTELTFAKRPGDVFDYAPSGTALFAMPQDGVYLAVVGNNRVEPPKARMSKDEMTAWVKSLKDQGYKMSAQDGLRHPLNSDV